MITVLQGDWIEQLKTLEIESVQCCVTSPPYWGLRDYGVKGQLGLEKTPEEYVAKIVEGFREVRRVLRNDGTLWLNLGDSYACTPLGTFTGGGDCVQGRDLSAHVNGSKRNKLADSGLKQKDLIGIPWRVAFALQSDGWYLRSDIIWHKPNPMPESVTDRPTKSHEYIFLLTKSARYFYDAEAIKEQSTTEPHIPGCKPRDYEAVKSVRLKANGESCSQYSPENQARIWGSETRNKRSVWTVPSAAYSEAHFATFPPNLINPCILAGTSAQGCCPKCGAPWERIVESSPMEINRSSRGEQIFNNKHSTAASGRMTKPPSSKTLGWKPTCECGKSPVPCTVLDPFGGSGTTGMVAIELGRKAILVELNPDYVELIHNRCNVTPGLALA